jgi:hypothetical protein
MNTAASLNKTTRPVGRVFVGGFWRGLGTGGLHWKVSNVTQPLILELAIYISDGFKLLVVALHRSSVYIRLIDPIARFVR